MRLRPVPALQDNYIWLLDDGVDAVVVDPGVASPVVDALAASGLQLKTMLLTHHHADHVGGVAGLLRHWPDAAVIGPRDDRIEGRLRRVCDGDVVNVESPRLDFRVMEIPGHTTSHIAFIGEGMLFCGDTLFSLGCGRMFEGTPAQFHDSLSRLAMLPGDTKVCCGHEYTRANGQFAIAIDPHNAALAERMQAAARKRADGQPTLPARLGDECAANPFLRTGAPAIIDALTLHYGMPPRDGVEAFAWLRALKDAFRPVPA